MRPADPRPDSLADDLRIRSARPLRGPNLWSLEPVVVAGTSAGAAAMGSTMLIGGPGDGTVRRQDISIAPGLSYWRDCVVDTHFNQRGRVSRLLTIFGHNPQVIGIGIDENTALDLIAGQSFTVIGAGAVTVFDGRVSYSSAPSASDHEVLAITDSVLHVLPEGYGFDLQKLRPRLPNGDEIIRTGSH